VARTYFFMGWNRDRDAPPTFRLDTLPLFEMPSVHTDMLDAMRYSMGATVTGWDLSASMDSEASCHTIILPNGMRSPTYATPHGAVICQGRKIGYCMAVVKDDDPRPNWDTVAMQQGLRWRGPAKTGEVEL